MSSVLKQVQPTKLELIRLKRSIQVSKRIHKILEDKKEVLLRRLTETVEEAKRVRETISSDLVSVYRPLLLAYLELGSTKVDAIARSTPVSVEVDVKVHKMMDVRIPSLIIKGEPAPARYGLSDTSVHLDETVKKITGILPRILKAAELENTIFRIAAELERTQRLINALEYIIIPSYEEAIRFVSMVLEEREREEFVRLKKLKAVLERKMKAREMGEAL